MRVPVCSRFKNLAHGTLTVSNRLTNKVLFLINSLLVPFLDNHLTDPGPSIRNYFLSKNIFGSIQSSFQFSHWWLIIYESSIVTSDWWDLDLKNFLTFSVSCLSYLDNKSVNSSIVLHFFLSCFLNFIRFLRTQTPEPDYFD